MDNNANDNNYFLQSLNNQSSEDGNNNNKSKHDRCIFQSVQFALAIVRNPFTQKWLAVNETNGRGWWVPGGCVERGDVLIGSWSMDTLTGGTGADTFLFETGHTGRWMGNADVITDFNQAEGDLIDLSAIDAIAGGADDAFTFLGTADFSGTAGELRSFVFNGNAFIEGDTDGDGVADFIIQIQSDQPVDLTAADFVL